MPGQLPGICGCCTDSPHICRAGHLGPTETVSHRPGNPPLLLTFLLKPHRENQQGHVHIHSAFSWSWKLRLRAKSLVQSHAETKEQRQSWSPMCRSSPQSQASMPPLCCVCVHTCVCVGTCMCACVYVCVRHLGCGSPSQVFCEYSTTKKDAEEEP